MRYTAWLVANTFWFGFFMYAVLFHGWHPLSLGIPIIFHWRIEDIK